MIVIRLRRISTNTSGICYENNLSRLAFTLLILPSCLILAQGTDISPRKHGLNFLLPLMDAMVQDNPSARPNIDEVVLWFDKLWRAQKTSHLRSRTQFEGCDELFPGTKHFLRRISYTIRIIPPVPSSDTIPSVALVPELEKSWSCFLTYFVVLLYLFLHACICITLTNTRAMYSV